MKKIMIVDAISLLFIILFVYAAVSKIIDFPKFQVQLGQSPLLAPFVNFVSLLIPALEIIISLMLLSYRFRLAGLLASFTLMLLFSFYIYAITRFSYFIPCSCGGILQHMNWNQHLIFNILFVALGAWAIFLDDSPSLFIAIKIRRNRKPVTE